MKSLVAKIVICILLCLGLGLASGFSTAEEINNWYVTIQKPTWNPPDWVFGPVWTLLYTLMGISLALVWHSRHPGKKKAILFFSAQFILNLCWSFIFFKLHLIGLAFVEIIIMLILIFITTRLFFRISKAAGILLVPYLLWVAFASVLNGTIWQLNS